MVEMELIVSAKLKALLPPLSDDELQQLEANIVSEGRVHDPILYWHDGKKNVIVDGMNRFAIAKRKGVPYRTEPMMFETIEDVEIWILDNALGRRNLMKPAEIRKVRGELYNRLKRKDGGHGPQKADGQNVRPKATSGGGSAAEVVAEKTGVDEKTVRRDGKRVEEIDSLSAPLRKVVEEGKVAVTDKELHTLAKADPTKQQEVARAVRTGQAKTVADAMATAGIKATPKRDLENCKHSWVSDGNGERYCEHCKVDHPDAAIEKDEGGKEIPESLLEVFRDRSKLKGIINRIGAIVKEIDELTKADAGQRLPITEIKTDAKNLQAAIKSGLPHAVCPYCRGKKCDKCDKLGWIHKARYDGIPEERR